MNHLSSPSTFRCYFGTYTTEAGSEGIYFSDLDRTTGELSAPKLVAKAPNPSFIALDEKRNLLFANLEFSEGDVSAFHLDSSGKASLLSTVNSNGGGPCHISILGEGKFLGVAAYGGGSVAVLPIASSGELLPPVFHYQNKGKGPNSGRQEAPHVHGIYPFKNTDLVYALDLGTDEVLGFRLDPTTGTLVALQGGTLKLPGGTGPRHLAAHPNLPLIYGNGELTNDVTMISVNEKTGDLVAKQTLSTLPAGLMAIDNTTAEIRVHPSGGWLFVSNRGHDSIAIYKLDKTGSMTIKKVTPLGLKEPRGFDLDPTGEWIVVGGQNSDEVRTFRFDALTGEITRTDFSIPISKPVCVVIAR